MDSSRSHGVQVVTDDRKVDHLVDELLDNRRYEPIVVVTTSTKASEPYLDVDWLADEIEGAAKLVVLTRPSLSYRLTERLGDQYLSVFGGAARVYPTGTAWTSRPDDAPLFFCYPGKGHSVALAIADHVRNLVYGRTALVVTPADSSDIPTAAVVMNWATDSQVIVKTADGTPCKMLAVHLYPGVAASRLVTPGQRFTGRQRGTGIIGDFFPDPVEDDPMARAREAFPDGAVTLARAERVLPSSAQLQIHPAVPAELLHAGDDLTQLITRDEVVAVEVAWDGDNLLAILAREEDVGTAMSLLPGGPPWLVLDDPTPIEDEHGTVADSGLEASLATIEDASPSTRDPDEAEATIALLTERQARLGSEVARLKHEIRNLRKERRQTARPQVHDDPERQFRFEVELSYLTRVPPADREEFPLSTHYEVGRDFLESLGQLLTGGAISRDKIVDVCADVLCGRAQTISARAVKPWLTSVHGHQMTRADGAGAWRIRLQANANGARRMKYWRKPDGVIEFDSVGVHDEGL